MTDTQADCWTLATLDKLARVGAGNPAPQDKKLFEGGKYPFIRTSDVGQVRFGEIGTAADLLNEQGAAKLRLVPKGTVLMPKSGASTFLNHRVLTTADAFVSSHLATITPKDGITDPRYLLYALSQVAAQDLLPENSYPSLNLNLIKNIRVLLPPIEEQQRLVALLDEAFEGLGRARAHAEANLQNAKEFFENSLLNMMAEIDRDAPRLSLSNASKDFGRGRSRHRPRNASHLYDGPYPFIQTGDIRNASGRLTEFSQTYSEDGLAQSKLWPAGTVCITIAANIAETAVMSFDGCFPDSVIGMVPNDQVTFPEYVEYMLRFFAADLKAQGKGSAQDNINLRTFERATFPFPPIEQQRQVVAKLDELWAATSDLVAAYSQKIHDFDDLRQSLLHKAFAGELTRAEAA